MYQWLEKIKGFGKSRLQRIGMKKKKYINPLNLSFECK
jgi:hypothetical protein